MYSYGCRYSHLLRCRRPWGVFLLKDEGVLSMSEFSRSSREAVDTSDDNVVSMREYLLRQDDEPLDPTELADEEVVEQFLSQLSHPSALRPSSELGEYIQRIIKPRSKDSLSGQDQAWRDRMLELMIEVDLLSDDELQLLLVSDPILQEIFTRLSATRVRAKELAEERAALVLLREVRAGSFLRNETTPAGDNRWSALINRLISIEN